MSAKVQSSDWAGSWTDVRHYAADVGFLLRVPWRIYLGGTEDQTGSAWFIRPAVGLAFLNDQVGVSRTYWLDDYIVFPTIRGGMAFEIFKTSSGLIGSDKLISATASYERQHPKEMDFDDDRSKFGMEAGFREALYLRLGHIDSHGEANQTTWGLGVNLQGIMRMFGPATDGSFVKFLQEELVLEYDFANYSDDHSYQSGVKFHQIRISY